MQINIVCIGKLKEKYWQEALAEYVKRLGPFCKLKILESSEDRTIEKETDKLLRLLPESSYVVLLDVIGTSISSPELADKLENLMLSGKSSITFVIGGAYGFTDELRQRADERISFSRLTFTHQMIRVILVEQIYRAFKIMRHEKYHN